MNDVAVEAVGWFSTALFLVSILSPSRVRLHQLGVLTALTTGIYAYHHGATAIWVKWLIAFFFHGYMWARTGRVKEGQGRPADRRPGTV